MSGAIMAAPSIRSGFYYGWVEVVAALAMVGTLPGPVSEITWRLLGSNGHGQRRVEIATNTMVRRRA